MVAIAASWSAFTIDGVFLGKKNADRIVGVKAGQALLIHAGEVGQCRRAFLGQNRDRLDSLAFDIADGARGIEAMVVDPARDQVLDRGAASSELLAAKDIVADLPGTFRAWQKGTVVRSWLLDLMVKALDEDPGLESISDYVEDSGEGRWTVEEAIANAVPAPAITAALFARFSSREDNSPAMKMVSALRHQFGGHATRPAK